MNNSMQTPWPHLRAPPTHLWSRDVINIIFGKTTITPSFVKLKTSSKNYNYPGRHIGSAQY